MTPNQTKLCAYCGVVRDAALKIEEPEARLCMLHAVEAAHHVVHAGLDIEAGCNLIFLRSALVLIYNIPVAEVPHIRYEDSVPGAPMLH